MSEDSREGKGRGVKGSMKISRARRGAGGDTLSLYRDQLYGPSLLLSIALAIISRTMIQSAIETQGRSSLIKVGLPESPK